MTKANITSIVKTWYELYHGRSYKIFQRPDSFDRALIEIQRTPNEKRYRLVAQWHQPGGASDKPVLVPAEFLAEIVHIEKSGAEIDALVDRATWFERPLSVVSDPDYNHQTSRVEGRVSGVSPDPGF